MISCPPLMDYCIAFQPKELRWMRATSVWDDVLHHGGVNNPGGVESAPSKHNGGSHFTGDELHWFTPRWRDQSDQSLPQRVFSPMCRRQEWEACRKTTLKPVTDIEEEWNDSTYTNCELKWRDKGKIQNIKVVTVRGVVGGGVLVEVLRG